jgi:hypothetical protein
MKNGRLQCKDIPDRPILELLAKNPGQWHFLWMDHEFSIWPAFPEEVCEKLMLSKMNTLIRRGLVDGCPCGCRGDFEIAAKGIEWLKLNTTPDEKTSPNPVTVTDEPEVGTVDCSASTSGG